MRILLGNEGDTMRKLMTYEWKNMKINPNYATKTKG